MAFALEDFFLPKRAATVALNRNAFEIAFQASERSETSSVVGRGRVVRVLVGEDARRFRPRTPRALKLRSLGWPGGVLAATCTRI